MYLARGDVLRTSFPLLLLLFLALLLVALPARSETRVYDTVRCSDDGPHLDGELDDACWNLVDWSGDFIEYQPDTGTPPTHQTQFKVVYNDEALYFGIRAFDDHPEHIASVLGRRDVFPGDWVEVNIDSYGDDRTAFSFTASVSGTRGDEFISNDGDNWDSSWDPVWDVATNIDDLGWTAEVRVPLSQLRFAEAPSHTWGLQITRRIFRQEERSTWAPKRTDQSGWVSLFGELRGLEGLQPSRRLELTPYTVGRAELFPEVEGDPFQDGRDGEATFGLDGKMGVTSDLTLDFTFNPDFGQIEADPSEVNLSAFETFFQERRPFFVEGRNILETRLVDAVTGGSFNSDRIFYSRRIGSAPKASPDFDPEAGESADQLDNTSILGAAKLTGKTSGGLSIGVMQALTAEEKVDIEGPSGARRQVVEPMTNTFVGRLQQDFREGATHLGVIGTAVHRRTGGTEIDFLHRQAYAGGLDLSHRWNDRRWSVKANLLFSRVQGSPEAIARTQQSSRRFFQREDNGAADFDPTRTSLTGSSGSFTIGRFGSQGVRFQTGVATRSPGFEINDAGFQRNANEVNQFGWISYRQATPFLSFRSAQLNFNQWNDWDYDGTHLRTAFNSNGNVQWSNHWSMGGSVTWTGARISNTLLRGGPSAKAPGSLGRSFWVNSDSRKDLYVGFGGYMESEFDTDGGYREAWTSTTWRPNDSLRLSLSPSWSRGETDLQYVATRGVDDADRYVFGALDQETFRFTFRVDYTITPDLTVQYYGQPFLSSGRYAGFRHVDAPRADAYEDRFDRFEGAEIALVDDVYEVDENRDGEVDFTFGRPDFDVRDFNSNLVLRWEYSAGSTLFLVWSQNRFGSSSRGRLDVGRDLDQLFADDARNVFLLKFSKWLSI